MTERKVRPMNLSHACLIPRASEIPPREISKHAENKGKPEKNNPNPAADIKKSKHQSIFYKYPHQLNHSTLIRKPPTFHIPTPNQSTSLSTSLLSIGTAQNTPISSQHFIAPKPHVVNPPSSHIRLKKRVINPENNNTLKELDGRVFTGQVC